MYFVEVEPYHHLPVWRACCCPLGGTPTPGVLWGGASARVEIDFLLWPSKPVNRNIDSESRVYGKIKSIKFEIQYDLVRAEYVFQCFNN